MLAQQLINGLMLGASYSLVAIGYTLIFGVLRLLHFAHGEVFMMGAFIGLHIVLYFAGANIYIAIAGAGLPFPVARNAVTRSARIRRSSITARTSSSSATT